MNKTSSFRTLAARLVQKNVETNDHLTKEEGDAKVSDPDELLPTPEFYMQS